MQIVYNFKPVQQLIDSNPEDPPYAALFYDPIDIALQRPNNESVDQRHDKIRNYLVSRQIHHARELFLSNEIQLLNRLKGIMVNAAFTVELESMEGSTKTGQDQLDDIFIMFEAVKAANGCLMVVQNCSPLKSPSYFAAVWGGIMSNSTFRLGCNGVITNGFVRDQYQLESVGNDFNYLVFGKAHCALDARGHLKIRSFFQPITMPGLDFHNRAKNRVRIEPGDFIVADNDGIIVIPQRIAQAVIDLSVERYHAERYIIRGIRSQQCENVIPFIKKHGIL